MRMGHVHRGAFVANIDDANAELVQVVPDRLDMIPLQAEYAIDTACDEEAGDDLGNGAAGLEGGDGRVLDERPGRVAASIPVDSTTRRPNSGRSAPALSRRVGKPARGCSRASRSVARA